MMVQRTTDAGGRPRAAISVSLRLFPLVAHSGSYTGVQRTPDPGQMRSEATGVGNRAELT